MAKQNDGFDRNYGSGDYHQNNNYHYSGNGYQDTYYDSSNGTYRNAGYGQNYDQGYSGDQFSSARYADPNSSYNGGFLADFAKVMSGVYLYMMAGLLVTAGVAYAAASSVTFISTIVNSGLFMFLVIAELAVVMVLSLAVNKLPVTAARLLFFAYAALTGLTFSVLLLVYTGASVASAFLVTCAVFGTMSVVGALTKKNLTSFGSYLMMALIGVMIAGLVNMFMRNTVMDFVISVIALLIFIGLTAYDTQKIKGWMTQVKGGHSGLDSAMVSKITIMGALTLYLDFINIFLRVLRFTGKRK